MLVGGSYNILGSHTYPDEGTFQVSVSVTDGAVSANFTTTASILEALLIDGTRGTANQRFISEVYHDLLGRPADLDGLGFWSGMLDQGVSRDRVVLRIEGSEEYHQDVVENLYEKLFGRAADPNGLSFWMNFLAQGNSAELLEARLMGSDEYFSRIGGGTNQGILRAVYSDVFNRDVDPAGAQGWGQELANGTDRTTVALAILSSLEADQDEVAALYMRLNDRPVDPSGLKAFTDLLQNGASYERAIAEIAGSDPATGGTGEYFAKTVR
jgi:hypothetical protein